MSVVYHEAPSRVLAVGAGRHGRVRVLRPALQPLRRRTARAPRPEWQPHNHEGSGGRGDDAGDPSTAGQGTHSPSLPFITLFRVVLPNVELPTLQEAGLPTSAQATTQLPLSGHRFVAVDECISLYGEVRSRP